MKQKLGIAGILIVCALIFSQTLFAEGMETSTNLEFQISSRPEAKLRIYTNLIFPFLQGEGPLTSGNNLTAQISAEATPVSLLGSGEIIWTPVAFFLLSGGGKAGSGWNIPIANGLGLNRPGDGADAAALPRESIIDGSAFDGLMWRAWGAGTLQFDLGAIVPGDWTHVLFQSRQEFRYSAYTRAGSGDSWIFENDDGENINGWTYNSAYVLGYQMPLSPVLDTIAFMAEMQKPLYRSPNGDFWGESLGKWTFTGLFNFVLNPRLSTGLAIQMRTYRNHGTSSFGEKDYFYQDLELKDDGGRRRLLFYRAALIFNWKIW